jgi:tetratricopeptide (TPR) repeat protein
MLKQLIAYSRSIVLQPTAVAFANRAMAYIKMRRFEEAEYDCSETIDLNDRYVKAYSRHGTAKKEIGKLLDAMDDFKFSLRLEPENKDALSAPLLMDIIRCVEHFFMENADFVVQFLENLTKIGRFDMTIMCLSTKDKAALRQMWDEVFVNERVPVDLQEALIVTVNGVNFRG